MKETVINKKLIAPHDCYIILTEKCNLRCLHCYGDFGESGNLKELSGEEWDKIIADLKANNVFYLNISGGEPTMHPDFCKIIKSLVDNKMHFILTTNGVFNKDCLNAILSAKEFLIGIKISLDGSDYESHCYLRRTINNSVDKKIFDKTIETIRVIRDSGIPLTIATCLHKENIFKIDELKNLILDIKPNSWFISTISTNGRSSVNKEIFVSDSEVPKKYWSNLKKSLMKKNIYVNYIDMDHANRTKTNSNFYYTCPAAKSFCEISSEGKVTPCPLARVNISENIIKFDNLKDKNLQEIWNGEPFKKFSLLSSTGCEGCKCKDKCDRCIPQSIEWFDDPSAPTPFCAQHGKELCLKNNEFWLKKLEEKEKEFNRNK